MTQYEQVVDRQRLLIDAEEWAEGIKAIHCHGIKSMWYETEDSIEDFENGNVTDIEYNSGLIERKQDDKLIRTFGSRATGDKLIDLYIRGGS